MTFEFSKKFNERETLICDTFLYHTLEYVLCSSPLIERIRDDPIVSFLIQKSSITAAQLDTMMAGQTSGNLSVKISSREKSNVSKGAFVRSLRQGQQNIESSIYSLMLVVYLGLVPQDKFDQFLKTQRIISKVRDLEPDKENTLRLINGLQEFVEDFSGKRERKAIL